MKKKNIYLSLIEILKKYKYSDSDLQQVKELFGKYRTADPFVAILENAENKETADIYYEISKLDIFDAEIMPLKDSVGAAINKKALVVAKLEAKPFNFVSFEVSLENSLYTATDSFLKA